MKKEVTLLFIFFCVTLLGALHHEVWLDEAHHWLFARDSNSVQELLFNMRYDGHPILWNLILFFITRFTQDVTVMQILHVCLATAAVAVFLFFSPFRFFEKALFVSGYFILYEYSVISRNYALLLLFLFLTIHLYNKRKYILLGLSLALLANTHLFALVIASFFVVIIGLEFILKKEKIVSQVWVGFIIFLMAATISVWQVIPPSDSLILPTAQKFPPLERLARTTTYFLKAFVTIPDFMSYHSWNSNILMSISKPLCAVLSGILFFVPALLFRNRIQIILFFYACAVFLFWFAYLSNLHAMRYYGVIYVVLICCFWLSRITVALPVTFLAQLKFKRDYSQQFLIGLLCVQAVGGLIAYTIDLRRPFSESKNAANIILGSQESGEYLSAGCGAAPVSAYLGKRVYYLNLHHYGSFCEFYQETNIMAEQNEKLKKDAVEFVERTSQPAFLISHIPLQLFPGDCICIQLMGSFEESIIRNEKYYIYKITLEKS